MVIRQWTAIRHDEPIIELPQLEAIVALAAMQPPPTAFIVTDRAELTRQPRLRAYPERFRRSADTPAYLVYGLRS